MTSTSTTSSYYPEKTLPPQISPYRLPLKKTILGKSCSQSLLRCNKDEYGRQQQPFAHAWRFTEWADAGFHSFDTQKHLGSRAFHASQRDDLMGVKDKRLMRQDRKHQLFTMRYERVSKDDEFLKRATENYKSLMQRKSEVDLKKSKSMSELAGLFQKILAEQEEKDSSKELKNTASTKDTMSPKSTPKSTTVVTMAPSASTPNLTAA